MSPLAHPPPPASGACLSTNLMKLKSRPACDASPLPLALNWLEGGLATAAAPPLSNAPTLPQPFHWFKKTGAVLILGGVLNGQL